MMKNLDGTTSKDVRAGNDGDRDSYEEYGIVEDISIDEMKEIQGISITRRIEENLPKEGENIFVTMENGVNMNLKCFRLEQLFCLLFRLYWLH